MASRGYDNTIELTGSLTRREGAAPAPAANRDTPNLVGYMRAGLCGSNDGRAVTPANGLCADAETPPTCDAGTTPVEPLWRRERATETSTWGPWELVTGWTCAAPDTPTQLTQADFRRLPLAAPGIRLQPAASEVLINMPTIAMADAGDQVLTTTLLGTPVEVRASAASYTWDYGDGTPPLTTTSPGRPYPEHDVHHTYTRPGSYTITLTTTWTGVWRVAGTTAWLPVQGTATTTATHGPVTAVEAPTRLVAEPCAPHDATC